MTQQITSKDNPLVKEAAALLGPARRRREQGRFLAEGARLCADGARSGCPPVVFFYTDLARRRYPDTVRLLEQAAEKTCLITEEVAAKLSDTRTPQGIFCIFPMLDKIKDLIHIYTHGRFIALENLQDPSNLGAVLRTAEALGVTGCILAGACCDPFSPKVIRGSMGAVFRLPLYQAGEGPAAVRALKKMGMQAYAAVPNSGAQPVTGCAFGPGSVLFIGNEGAGLLKETVAACGKTVTIPMLGRAESLNAAMAAGILMWEMMRGEPPITKEQ